MLQNSIRTEKWHQMTLPCPEVFSEVEAFQEKAGRGLSPRPLIIRAVAEVTVYFHF
jgi:hypothetical protein